MLPALSKFQRSVALKIAALRNVIGNRKREVWCQVKQVRDKDYQLGKDIGIISYNDTPLKELLGITVISTDFKKMGTLAAKMIVDKKISSVKNDFNFIDRNSA